MPEAVRGLVMFAFALGPGCHTPSRPVGQSPVLMCQIGGLVLVRVLPRRVRIVLPNIYIVT